MLCLYCYSKCIWGNEDLSSLSQINLDKPALKSRKVSTARALTLMLMETMHSKLVTRLRDFESWIKVADTYQFLPNRIFLAGFGGISGQFDRAMVRVLLRRSRAKIPMVRPNEPDMPPKRTKKDTIRVFTVPKFCQVSMIS